MHILKQGGRMKKFNQIGCILCSVFAVFLYFQHKDEKTISVFQLEQNKSKIEIVLLNSTGHLVPFTVNSSCSTEVECLNEAVSLMSESHGIYHAIFPKHTQVLSVQCDKDCVVDFSKELLEYNPAKRIEIQQALSYLMKQVNCKLFTVEGQVSEKLTIDEDVLLNQSYFIDSDLHRGYLYQMYMNQNTDNGSVLIPVIVHAMSDDFVKVLETYYTSSTSVQCDTLNFREFQLIEGDILQLHLSDECIINHTFVLDKVLPVLFSLKERYPEKSVKVLVDDVIVQEIQLSELRINEFLLPE